MDTFAQAKKFDLKTLVDYLPNGIGSRQIIRNKAGNCTLFAFDSGQALSRHVSDFDALVQVVEGEAVVIIGDEEILLVENEAAIMPANIPHELRADKRFKMILTIIKG
jgi:quercetin dioxygenase-like cupin family protein